MLFRLVASLLLLSPLTAAAQYQGCRQLQPTVDPNVACIQISGSNLRAPDGSKLANGQVTLTVTDSGGNPVTYTPLGGTASTAAFVAHIVNGSVQTIGGYPFSIVNTLNASPTGLVFHFQLQSVGGSTTYQDYPLWNLSSATGGSSLDSFVALSGTSISGMGYPRTRVAPTAKYTQTDAPGGAKPWIGSVLWRSDKTIQWTQNPSSDPNCPMGQAIVSPYSGPAYCILPENAYALPGEGFVNPSTDTPGPIEIEPLSQGGANLPHVLEVLAGDGIGGALGMPEMGVTKSGSTGLLAWAEDAGMAQFDCRDTKYGPGGCLGAHPQQAMQDLANDIVCYQSTTGLHPNVKFPPGFIKVGLPAAPTLNLPTGAYYYGASQGRTGIGTEFVSSYNGHRAIHIFTGVTATCPDGNVHTNTLQDGKEVGWGQSGCNQGGCSNLPGDTTSYVLGGQAQAGILIEDQAGVVANVGASNNGGDGLVVGGEDTEVDSAWGAHNMYAFIFYTPASGETYNPATDPIHCNICLIGLDGTWNGPFETYGALQPPNASLLHLAGVEHGGGDTGLGPVFSNRDAIGVIRPAGQQNGRMIGGRIDGPGYEGIVVGASKGSITGAQIITACSEMAGIAPFAVFGPYIASRGSGMTNGTYVVPADSGAATLTLTVAGGVATNVTVSNAGGAYMNPAHDPVFTVTGTGGTPAVIGARVYYHCDYLDDVQGGGQNGYVNVVNTYDPFFGANNATGAIWPGAGSSTFDRGTTGSFERISLTGVQTAKGVGNHKDLLDPFENNGGIGVGTVSPQFLGGNHFFSTDSTPTSWTGPFGYEFVMQDIWLLANNANTTLPYASGWHSCLGVNHDATLAPGPQGPYWQHWFVLQDDVFHVIGTNMIFQEQCELSYTDQIHVNWLSNLASLAPTEQQGTLDVMGNIAVHALPKIPTLTIQAGGTPGANGVGGTYTYVLRIWVAGGAQVSASASVTQCLPKAGFINNPCFQTIHWADPAGWTHWQLYRNSSTDGTATAGLIAESIHTTPQPANPFDNGWPDSQVAPVNATTIPSGWLNTSVTGTISSSGSDIPTSSSFPGVPGQQILDRASHSLFICDSDDHWQVSVLPAFNNF